MRSTIALGFLALASFACSEKQKAPRGPRTVVLFTLDTYRCDRIGSYGGDPAVTPNLDALAKSGARFARCLTVSPNTLPAHASILSGVDPIAHGLRVNGLGQLPSDLPTLATSLHDAGYATAAFVSSTVLERRHGLDRGFDRYEDREGQDPEIGIEQRRGGTTVDLALFWLREIHDAPAFLWVHLFDAHAPYVAPIEYGTKFKTAYEGEMAYVDACVGRFLEGLAAAGRRDDSLIAVVADHGEGLGDHGESTHTVFVYDTTIHVPLLFAGKGVTAGQVVDGTVSTISIAPTLLELCGAKVEASMYGASLADVVRGKAKVDPRDVRFESMATQYFYGFAPLSGIEEGGLKLIAAPRPELYEPLADPKEASNLFDARRKDADSKKRALDEYERTRERRFATAQMTSEAKAELKQFGYLAGATEIGHGDDPKDGIAKVEQLSAANDLLVSGNGPGAVRSLDEFNQQHPGVAEAHELLGDALRGIGQLERAIKEYKTAIVLRTGDAGLRVKLAETLLGRGKPGDIDLAKQEFVVAMQTEPNNVEAGVKWALVLAQIVKNLPDARTQIDSVVRGAGASRPDAWTARAMIALQQSDRPATTESIRRAIELSPPDLTTWERLGGIAEAAGEIESAIRCFERALAIAKRMPGAEAHVKSIDAKLDSLRNRK